MDTWMDMKYRAETKWESFRKRYFQMHFLIKSVVWWLGFQRSFLLSIILTRWGRVTHICVSRLTITVSDNGLSPGRRQAIIWTNAGIFLIGPLGTDFSENSIEILTFSFTKMRLKVSSAKWRPFCLGLNVLTMSQHWFSSQVGDEQSQTIIRTDVARHIHAPPVLSELGAWQRLHILFSK